MKIQTAAVFAAVAMATAGATAQTQGVSKTDILVGAIQDLSGPLAVDGKWKVISDYPQP